MNWLITQLCKWDEIDEELKQYYEAVKRVCKGRTDIEFLGCYAPQNEEYNWAFFYKVVSWERFLELESEWVRLHGGRPKNAKTVIIRMYQEYQP